MLRPWKTDSFAEADFVSIGGSFENQLQLTEINGDTGETKVGDFHLALQQSELASGIDDSQTSITLSFAMFFTTVDKYPLIIIGSEKMKITDGFGTTSLTVIRGWNGTTPASHSAEDPVRSAYKATNITLTAVDLDTPPDESSWLTFRDYESGSYESPHAVADIDFDESVHIQFQAIVPEAPAQYKRDLTPRINCKLEEIPNP